MSRNELVKKGADKFSKGKSNLLMYFLNAFKDQPIVAHYVEHDRDQVLSKAFEKASSQDILPPKDRWRCTFEMAKQLPGIKTCQLDDVLEYFNYERRDPEAKHDALEDCRLTAKVYMEMMKRP